MKRILVATAVLLAAVSARAAAVLEYVEASGGAYVDSGYCANEKTVLAFKGMYVNLNSATYASLFIAATGDADVATRLMLQNTNVKSVYAVCYTKQGSSLAFNNVVSGLGVAITGRFDRVSNQYVINAQTQTHSSPTTGNLTAETVSLHHKGKSPVTRLYYFTVSEDGVPVHDFLPYEKDGEVGYFNLVTKEFHTNACETGTLTAGPVRPGLRIGDGGDLECLVTVTNNADEAVLSLDGGATWIANTNAWVEYGASVTVTLKPAARGRFAFFGSTGKGTWDRAAGTFTVNAAEPMTVLAREAAAYVWKDGDGNFTDPAHWTGGLPGTYPCEVDTVTIGTDTIAYTVTVTAPISVARLTVAGAVLVEEDPDDDLVTTVNFQTGFATNVIAGALEVKGAACLTHPGNAAAQNHALVLHAGSVTVDASGRIDVQGKGYKAGKGVSYSSNAGWHGGDNNAGDETKCYGSVRYPTAWGCGSAWDAGGGAVRLIADGAVTVNGKVIADGVVNAWGGAGGSVWITCGTLGGTGTIEADANSSNQSAGGRISVTLTAPGARFGTWDGRIHAWGTGNGAPGTVYLQNGDQKDGYGTLIVDSNGTTRDGYTTINNNVTDADVGDVVVRRNGKLRVAAGTDFIVKGSITNSATISCSKGSRLVLASTNDCHVSGTVTADALVCTTPGKRIFTGTGSGDGLVVAADGSLTLTGTAEKPIVMLSETGADPWKFTVNANVAKDVSYVSVSNCNGSAGYEVTDFGGTDLGGNTKWLFPPPLVPGATNAWQGTVSSDPGVSANWSQGRCPEPTDTILVKGDAPNALTLTAASVTYNSLLVEEGARVNLDGAALTVTNVLDVAGVLACGTAARTLTFFGDATFANATSFVCGVTRTVLAGGAKKTLDAHGTSFYALELDATCGDVTFASDVKATRIRSRPGGALRTVATAAGATIEAVGMLLDGRIDADAKGLALTGVTDGAAWKLKAKYYATIRNASVKDCDASGSTATPVVYAPYENVSGNTDVTFSNGTPFMWTGAVSQDFAAGGNWQGGTAPGAADVVFVLDTSVRSPKVSAAATVGQLVIGDGVTTVAFQNTAALQVAGMAYLVGPATLTLDKPVTTGGDLVMETGVTVTHSGPLKATQSATSPRVDLTVGGDAHVQPGAIFNVVEKGYNASYSPAGSGVAGWHGGDSGSGCEENCYGSIRCPTTYGSGANWGGGGGAVKMTVTGKLTLDGTVDADAGNTWQGQTGCEWAGGGGSVWLTCRSLAGTGRIKADAHGWHNGAGGRVALKLTGADARFGDWESRVSVAGSGVAAVGTLYLQDGSQADGFGTLIVDSKGTSRSGYTTINGNVTETDVGDVIVRGNGKLRISPTGTLTVNGSITNAGTVTCMTGSTLALGSTNDCTISGGLTACNLVCTVPGKRIYAGTAASDALAIAANGMLKLAGSEAKPLVILPKTGTDTFTLTVNANVTKDVSYVSISNCNGSAGYEVIDFGGTDLGGNSKWKFQAMIVPGETNVWTGAVSADPGLSDNWSQKRCPEPTDTIVVKAGTPHGMEITASYTTYNSLTVEEGARLVFDGDVLTVTNFLSVAGVLDCGGAEARTLVLPPVTTFANATSLVCGASRALLTGAAKKTVDAHDAAFYLMELDATCGDVTFASGLRAERIRSRVGSAMRTLATAAGATLEAEGLLLDGRIDADTKGLTLKGVTDGVAWKLKATHYATIRGASVQDCDASASPVTPIVYAPYANVSGNTDVTFDDGAPFFWTGAASQDFAAGGNWLRGTAPGAGDAAFVLDTSARSPKVSAAATVGALVIGDGVTAVTFQNTAALQVKGAVHCVGSATLTLDKPVTAESDLRMGTGVTVTHSGPLAGVQAETSPRVDLTVGGNARIHAGVTFNVVEKGYAAKRNPSGNSAAGWHGGDSGSGCEENCYGSVRYPTTYGSGSEWAGGGGAVKMTVGEWLTLNGTINADAGNTWQGSEGCEWAGGGGSVWITCRSLDGTGRIKADGHGWHHGSGGRVALKLTGSDARFGDWESRVSVAGSGSAGAGTVYLQDGSQADGFGTLIVRAASGCTTINRNVTDAEVGDVVVKPSARFRISPTGTLTVNGSIANAGTVTCMTGSTLVLASLNDCRISGALSAYNLVCEVPGKRILFPTNAAEALTIQANGSLKLAGAKGSPVWLLPSAGGTEDFWRLTVNAGVDQDLTWVAASNSLASVTVTSFGSRDLDLGGNDNWLFKDFIYPGEEIVWTAGAGDSDMENALNWDRSRRPVKTDVVVIAPTACDPVLTAATMQFNSLVVQSGATLTMNGSGVAVTNRLEVNGTLKVNGIQTIVSEGDVLLGSAASLEAPDALFALTGGTARTVSARGAKFHRLELDGSCGDVDFPTGFAADLFKSTAGETVRELTFASGADYRVGGLWIEGRIEGEKGLTMKCTSGSAKWRLAVDSFAYVRGVSVRDSDATAGRLGVTAYRPCENLGNNAGWTFLTESDPAMWKGGTDLSFDTAANWESGAVPGADDVAYLPGASGTVTLTTYRKTLAGLVIGGTGNAVTFSSPRAFACTGSIAILDGGTAVLDNTVTVGGDLTVEKGGMLTHSGPAATETAGVSMDVAGNVSITAGGTVDVRAKGFSSGNGPAKGTSGGHAALVRASSQDTGVTYGALASPTNYGSAGSGAAGAGRVRIFAGGTFDLRGTVTAAATDGDREGAGGSVWIRAGALTGNGEVSVRGYAYEWGPGPGRVSIETTGRNGAADWMGTVVYGGGTGGGSFYFKRAEDKYGTASIAPDQCGVRFGNVPGAEDVRESKNIKVVTADSAHVRMKSDYAFRDLYLGTNATLALDTYTLTIHDPQHKNGRNWGTGVTVTSNTVEEVSGRIVWVPQGTVLIVR